MHLFETECFEDLINNYPLEIKEAGPLYNPIKRINIKRDSNLNIIFTTISDINAVNNQIDIPLGTVFTDERQVILKNYNNYDFILNSVSPYSYKISDLRTEESSVYSVEANLSEHKESDFLIEWVTNMDKTYFSLPDTIESFKKIEINKNIGKINLHTTSTSNLKSRNSIHIKINDFSLYLCRTEGKEDRSAYILYENTIKEEIRNKIRDCISFVLGMPLIYLGFSTFTKDSNLVSFKAIKGYDFNGAFKLNNQPPTSLHSSWENGIETEVFNKLVSSLYNVYDLCNFNHLSWRYWHAVCSPSHSAAVQFGACIESLQKSYFDNSNKKINSKIIQDKSIWKIFSKSAIDSINQLTIDKDEKDILIQKVSNINVLPQQLKLKKFLSLLQIEFSIIESQAWQQRNDSAHGNIIQNNDNIKVIRELKILRTIFNRIILSISKGSNTYYDYYTITHPLRHISQSIP